MKVALRDSNGFVKEVKLGFSWTVLFFGFFVPLIRGDWKWLGIMLVISIFSGLFTLGLGAFVANIILAFNYNKFYAKELYQKGYRSQNDFDHNALLNFINKK